MVNSLMRSEIGPDLGSLSFTEIIRILQMSYCKIHWNLFEFFGFSIIIFICGFIWFPMGISISGTFFVFLDAYFDNWRT